MVAQSLKTSGIAACRDDLVQTYRRYGVTDAGSLLKRTGEMAKNPIGDSFAAAVKPKIRRGTIQIILARVLEYAND
jgi:hypothetical protein